MNIYCPQCQKLLDIPDDRSGERISCPSCTYLFVAPIKLTDSQWTWVSLTIILVRVFVVTGLTLLGYSLAHSALGEGEEVVGIAIGAALGTLAASAVQERLLASIARGIHESVQAARAGGANIIAAAKQRGRLVWTHQSARRLRRRLPQALAMAAVGIVAKSLLTEIWAILVVAASSVFIVTSTSQEPDTIDV